MKESPSKTIALKIDVIGPEKILFAGASMLHSAWNFTDWSSEGVNCSEYPACASKFLLQQDNCDQHLTSILLSPLA